MLKGIPDIVSPELLKVMMEMGHGDEIVIADGNFPGASVAKDAILIRADGHGACEILDAILKLLPIDTYEDSIFIMDKVEGDPVRTPIWDRFENVLSKYSTQEIKMLERYAFYERAKKAYAVVQTGETALYGDIIIKKGTL